MWEIITVFVIILVAAIILRLSKKSGDSIPRHN